MRPLYTLVFAFALMFTSCDKDLSYEGGFVPPVEEPPVVIPPSLTTEDKLKDLFADYKFQLRAFYSDIPIKFDPSDQNAVPETDLFHYVPAYLKDDANRFSEDGEVIIEQNDVKRPGLAAASLSRSYNIREAADGYYLVFLDALYDVLEYRIAEVGADYFILSVDGGNGATLYSRFEKLQ